MSNQDETQETPVAEPAKAEAPEKTPTAPAPLKAEAESPAKTEAPAAEEPKAAAEEKPADAAPVPVAGRKRAASKNVDTDRVHGLGRRKTAVARVALKSGEGNWKINGRTLEEFFPRPTLQQTIRRPLVLTETDGQYDIFVRVAGGGMHGQADAVRLGISRALVKIDEENRRLLRSEDLLTRDAREVERKKPGRPKARKRFQFSKR